MRSSGLERLPAGIGAHLARMYPGARITAIEDLAPDTGAGRDHTSKAAGYSRPARLVLETATGAELELVWRVATSNELGHDRRSDRAANQLQAYDDFSRIPRHIHAVDVGAIDSAGALISLRDHDETYLITSYVHGTTYAEDLRQIARDANLGDLDIARCTQLATYLAQLHEPIDDPIRYRRAIRDLIGHGEGIYGIVDAYPHDVPGAPSPQLHAIETQCAKWRWRLRDHEGRLVRTHGDFHPFNVVFGDGVRFALLDASRGACGDPADDVTAMAINYLLFALDAPRAWQRGLGVLWHRFWATYRAARTDASLLVCVPPFFAWRALVVCNPRFYPELTAGARAALLGFAEAALEAEHFDPKWADELFE